MCRVGPGSDTTCTGSGWVGLHFLGPLQALMYIHMWRIEHEQLCTVDQSDRNAALTCAHGGALFCYHYVTMTLRAPALWFIRCTAQDVCTLQGTHKPAHTHKHTHCINNKIVLVKYGSAWVCHIFLCMKVTESMLFRNHHDASVFVFLFTSPQTSSSDSSPGGFVCLLLLISVSALATVIATDRVHANALQTDRISLSRLFLSTERQHQCTVWRNFILWNCSHV